VKYCDCPTRKKSWLGNLSYSSRATIIIYGPWTRYGYPDEIYGISSVKNSLKEQKHKNAKPLVLNGFTYELPGPSAFQNMARFLKSLPIPAVDTPYNINIKCIVIVIMFR